MSKTYEIRIRDVPASVRARVERLRKQMEKRVAAEKGWTRRVHFYEAAQRALVLGLEKEGI